MGRDSDTKGVVTAWHSADVRLEFTASGNDSNKTLKIFDPLSLLKSHLVNADTGGRATLRQRGARRRNAWRAGLVVVAEEHPGAAGERGGVGGDDGVGAEVLGGGAAVRADGDDDAGGVGLGVEVGRKGRGGAEAFVVVCKGQIHPVHLRGAGMEYEAEHGPVSASKVVSGPASA